jgi:hypothetical protein
MGLCLLISQNLNALNVILIIRKKLEKKGDNFG